MRKIDERAQSSFWNGTALSAGNTRIIARDEYVALLLHGTPIAWRPRTRTDRVYVTLGGWPTRTTRARLNAVLARLGARVRQHKHAQWLHVPGTHKPVRLLPHTVQCVTSDGTHCISYEPHDVDAHARAFWHGFPYTRNGIRVRLHDACVRLYDGRLLLAERSPHPERLVRVRIPERITTRRLFALNDILDFLDVHLYRTRSALYIEDAEGTRHDVQRGCTYDITPTSV